MLCVLIRIALSRRFYCVHTIYNFQYKKITALNYPKSAALGFFKGLEKEFETAMVNESSVFEPLKFYCSNIGCFMNLFPVNRFIEADSLVLNY